MQGLHRLFGTLEQKEMPYLLCKSSDTRMLRYSIPSKLMRLAKDTRIMADGVEL
jgi:hypothetical protein